MKHRLSHTQFTSSPCNSFNIFHSINMSTDSNLTVVAIVVATIVVGIIMVMVIISMIGTFRSWIGEAAISGAHQIFPSPTGGTYQQRLRIFRQQNRATMEKFFNEMAREKPIRYPPHQLVRFTNNFSTKLGSGGFGVVYRGAIPNGMQIAVKVLSGTLDKKVEKQFMAEVSTIGRTYHINLVRLYGFCFDVTMRALVYEYMENGSLDKFLFGRSPRIEWEKLQEIAIGTAKGIAYLHEECEHRIIHYDIKPGNVLLDANFSPKVADFGLAKLCNRDRTHVTMTGGRGTPGYAAPELWMPFPITHKCDVYSYGMMLFEIVGRKRNLDVTLSESQEWFPRWVWKKFEDGEVKEMLEGCEIEERNREKAEMMVMIAFWCVQYSPESRPPMSSVVKMLDGGAKIVPPPNPFQHLVASAVNQPIWSETESAANSSSADTNYQSTTPIMRKYEIEVASFP